PIDLRVLHSFPTRRSSDLPYLPDALPRHAHERADFLERHGLAALFEAVVEIEDFALARRQILLEDAVDELTHQLAVSLLLDLAADRKSTRLNSSHLVISYA